VIFVVLALLRSNENVRPVLVSSPISPLKHGEESVKTFSFLPYKYMDTSAPFGNLSVSKTKVLEKRSI
jgi:hypothetical protein